MKRKFSSRKFILSVAAFLGSISVSIAGLITDNSSITVVGIVCGIISSALYAAVEGYVDAAHIDDDNIEPDIVISYEEDEIEDENE